jgi:hypothetical protein
VYFSSRQAELTASASRWNKELFFCSRCYNQFNRHDLRLTQCHSAPSLFCPPREPDRTLGEIPSDGCFPLVLSRVVVNDVHARLPRPGAARPAARLRHLGLFMAWWSARALLRGEGSLGIRSRGCTPRTSGFPPVYPAINGIRRFARANPSRISATPTPADGLAGRAFSILIERSKRESPQGRGCGPAIRPTAPNEQSASSLRRPGRPLDPSSGRITPRY